MLYTTGEVAKLCGVSVRTVQYYDTRNILTPSELSEGGRRLYSEEDVRRMKIICFLRDAGISISSIEGLLAEKEPGKVIHMLIEQQDVLLNEEITERQTKLEMLGEMKKTLKGVDNFSFEAIGDIAHKMENKKQLQKLHVLLLITGIPINISQWAAFIYGIVTGVWWPLLCWFFTAVPYGIWLSARYFGKVAYICPECHTVFKPKFKEALFADHTATLRKVTCTCCGYKGFCIETYHKEDK